MLGLSVVRGTLGKRISTKVTGDKRECGFLEELLKVPKTEKSLQTFVKF